MTSAHQQHDLLVQQLAIIERRIDWALDRNDRRQFVLSCQHWHQVKHRLLALAEAPLTDDVEAD